MELQALAAKQERAAWPEQHPPARIDWNGKLSSAYGEVYKTFCTHTTAVTSSHNQEDMRSSLTQRAPLSHWAEGCKGNKEKCFPLSTPCISSVWKTLTRLPCHLGRSLINKIRELNILHYDWLHYFLPFSLFFPPPPPPLFQYLKLRKCRKPFILSGVVYCTLVTQ